MTGIQKALLVIAVVSATIAVGVFAWAPQNLDYLATMAGLLCTVVLFVGCWISLIYAQTRLATRVWFCATAASFVGTIVIRLTL
jgi:hypothetical protein